jgi:hypothetical protein
MSPVTIGVENDVPLHCAMPENVRTSLTYGSIWQVYDPLANALTRFSPGA